MRTLTAQIQVSADGYMAGPNGEMDWLTTQWSGDLVAYVAALTENVDTIVLGRRLAEGFIPTWAERPEEPGADTFNNSLRIVVSRTLTDSPWPNAEVVGDVAAAVEKVRHPSGGSAIVYGGATLIRELISARLVDDLHVFINPTAIGAGLPAFPDTRTRLQVVGVSPFDCGVTATHYRLVD